MLKVLIPEQWSLDKLGVTQGHIDDVMAQCVLFIALYYGHQGESSMTAVIKHILTHKMGNHKLNTALKLRALPPTTKAYEQYVRRVHLLAEIWRSALCQLMCYLSLSQYGK